MQLSLGDGDPRARQWEVLQYFPLSKYTFQNCRFTTYRHRFARAAPAPRAKRNSKNRGRASPVNISKLYPPFALSYSESDQLSCRAMHCQTTSKTRGAAGHSDRAPRSYVASRKGGRSASSRGAKRQNRNKSLLFLKYFPKCLPQNNNGFLYSLAQIKNRHKTVRALALGNFPNPAR